MNLNDSGAGSLRQAILDTPADGTVDFQQGLNGTITLTSGELLINKNLTISRPGADVITVSGNNASRVFQIGATFTVAISGLTIAQGRVSSTNFAAGGGVSNGGALTLSRCTVVGNAANAPSTGNANGGGIYNFGTLTLTDSTVSGNSVFSSHGASGGGIYNTGTAVILNPTISGDSAASQRASAGGGIDNTGTLTVTSSTLSGNSATGSLPFNMGGGIDNDNAGGPASTTARNTILAANTSPGSPDMSGVLNSQGHNLIGNGTGGSGYDPTDLVGTSANPIDPMLGPLQDNGGPTFTMALLPGSPAIDAGDNTGAPPWDQRGPGFHRIVNGTIDIGAFEVQAHAHNPPTGQPLPDPLPVQVLATPAPPLLGQPPDLPTDPSPLPGPGIPNGQTGQPEPAPVPTATGQQAPATSFGTYPGTGQPVASLGSLSASDLDALALNLLGGT
jgi:hypothetical protein